MKRKALTFALIIVTLVLMSLTTSMTKSAKAADTDYTIEKVNHAIEVMYNGYIFINDTIQINGTASDGFLIGFPYKYGSHVLRCVAYNATDVFPVSLNVPLENRSGFYGVKINFLQGTPQIFTVGFVLSNNLIVQESFNVSRIDFPKYPSLTKSAVNCNVSILLPEGSTYMSGASLEYSQENLPAFTNLPADVTFSLTEDAMQIVDIKELKREIKISGTGEIEGSDSYRITNKAPQGTSFFEIILPQNASNPSAYDQLGRGLKVDATGKANRYQVSLASPLKTEESAVFTVRYYLPGECCIEQKEGKNFDLAFPLFQHLNYYIDQSSVTFVLPEGAKMLSFENASVAGSYSVTRDVFQEMLTVNREGVFWLDSFSVGITYEYDFLWLSFRPTLWMWALATVGCAIAVVWKRPKAPISVTVPKVAIGVRSRDIKSFVDTYEKKRRIVLEIESLKTRVRKGKIPRRRYKVRRRTLETRLNTLSRSLTDLKEKLRAAGGRYRDLMRRLEVAETEISGVEANIESIEARHRRGELSLGAYRKLLADYERRKDKAETAIDEILIRLREEIH
ncbi:MAG: hypothetical protein NWE85_04505 [Candidatus Bathyarchaeota archaeon]|nr:hypothetical protein [Candidatus Bathyarchaeota archaeon]